MTELTELPQAWPAQVGLDNALRSAASTGTVADAILLGGMSTDLEDPDARTGTSTFAELGAELGAYTGTVAFIGETAELIAYTGTVADAEIVVGAPPVLIVLDAFTGTEAYIGETAELFASTGTVADAVLDAPAPDPYATFPNGYRVRVRAVLPGVSPAETLQHQVVRLDATRNRFRSTDQPSGLVSHGGLDTTVVDIASGATLPRRLVYHDPVAGRLILDVQLGASSVIGPDHRQLYIYAGRTAAPPSQELDSPDVFGSFAFAFDPTNGSDLTGRKRHLTLVGSPSTVFVTEGPAMTFNGATQAGYSEHQIDSFAGLSAISAEMRVFADVAPVSGSAEAIVCIGPTMNESTTRHVLSIHRTASSALGGSTNALIVWVTVRKTDGTLEMARWHGPTDSGVWPASTMLAVSWQSGQAIRVYRDGALLAPVWTGALTAGGTNVEGALVSGTTGWDVNVNPRRLWVGRGPSSTGTSGFRGRIEMLRLLSRGML